MKELLRMWTNTRMIVLVAISAAVYAAVLIPFKAIPVVPGLAEIRPAAALPPLCSLLFGPAGAVGAAFGNLIGDFFGMLGPGSFFGMIGNFLYAYIPYRAWRALSGGDPRQMGPVGWVKLELCMVLASLACGVSIGWGLELVQIVPFKVLANVICINNLVVSMILSPILLLIFYPMIKRFGQLYSDVMEQDEISAPILHPLGLLILAVGCIGGLVAGNLLGFGILDISPFLGDIQIPMLIISPFILLIFLGALLL